MMEVEEDDTIAQVKLQFQLVSSQRVASDARLNYRYKLLQDAKTVKEEGLVGGETLKYHWGQVPASPEPVRHFHGETSNSNEAGGRAGARLTAVWSSPGSGGFWLNLEPAGPQFGEPGPEPIGSGSGSNRGSPGSTQPGAGEAEAVLDEGGPSGSTENEKNWYTGQTF